MTADNDSTDHKKDVSFLIVGIGASAGGLEAFQKFFSGLPDNPNMAFVLIQHLDPNHESMMPDLLSRHTGLKVMQVKKQTAVENNTVYIIPPGKYLGFEDHHLVLSDPPESRGMRMAIDYFFKTLAENLVEKAICIVLSGTGSDGTMGLREVKASGGLAIVQDPDTAQHDGMPRSAINTGSVDRILSPEQMPALLLEYAKHPYVNGVNKGPSEPAPENDFLLEEILNLLYAKTGHEFKHYKKNTLGRRIQRRMSLNHIGKAGDYIELLRNSQQENEELFKDLLINVTAFFREPAAWDILKKKVIPKLIDRCNGNHPVRVWTPGCASGEEAYSIAMLLHEALDNSEKRCGIQIFGTDIDKDAFQIARNGRYPESIAAQVSEERLDRFFTKEEGFFVVKKQLRESVVFAPQSLINDPPFSNQDLIICRNLLIYLKAATQLKVIRLFHFALKDDGYLFLGNAETIGSQKDLFSPVSKTWRIYQRIGGVRPHDLELPVFRTFKDRYNEGKAGPARRERVLTPASITCDALVKHYAPPAVLVDRNLEILFYQGDTSKFLKQPEGEPTRNILEQLIPSLRTQTRWLLQKVIETHPPHSIDRSLFTHPDGTREYVTIEAILPSTPPEAKGLILVTFTTGTTHETDIVSPKPDSKKDGSEDTDIQQLEDELQIAREELQSTVEEMETSNEELKASNEEVMSMNEELQSTNEEMETSKEELQSLNEELTTVNNELQEKVSELEEANDDMANLLSSTHIPTIFLDREFRIKRFTPAATQVMHLVGSDTGRQIMHIVQRFHDPDLIEDIQKVLKDLIPIEREISMKHENQWYIRRVLPYRTQDDRIAGVVLTFVDFTQRRKDLEEIKAKEDQLRKAILLAPLPIILFAEDEQILLVSRTWTEITGYEAEELKTISQWTQKAYGDKDTKVKEHIQHVLAAEKQIDEGEFAVMTKAGVERIWHFHSAPLGRLRDGRRMIVGMAIDMTTRRKYEKDLEEKEDQLKRINKDLELKVTQRTRRLEEKNKLLEKMAMDLSQVEQREKRKLASTLHDNLQQLLASARFRLETYSRKADKEDTQAIDQILQLLNDASAACRDVTLNLASPVLYDAGLLKALKWLCKNSKDNHGLEVSCTIPDSDQRFFDQDTAFFIFQSIKELLFNVVKHSGQTRAGLSVDIKENSFLIIRVSDEGCGFEVQETGDGFVNGGGYGLISIQQRMAFIGGRMEIQSSPVEGTCVDIILPINLKDGRKSGEKTDSRKRELKTKDNCQISVLLVDDHPIFREGLKTLLENEKDIVVAGEAVDGADAVEKAKALEPQVILMDINMPGMNGIEATRKISSILPHICIIGLSVNAEDDIAEAMLSAGAAAYLLKGGAPDELLDEIRKDC
ncbi:chemotaxis protein CheB [Desulfocicer niacini]